MNVVILVVALVSHAEVFDLVGYMYYENPAISWPRVMVAGLLLVCISLVTHFNRTEYRHALDLCILGLVLPIATAWCLYSRSVKPLLWACLAVWLMAMTIKVAEGSRVFRRSVAGNLGNGFFRIQVGVLGVFVVLLVGLLGDRMGGVGWNLVETYEKTYEIRATTPGDGMLGYFVGSFVLFFFPVLLSESKRPASIVAPVAAFMGATLVYQTLALKGLFLTFFLLLLFEVGRRSTPTLREHLPQGFFLAVFVVAKGVGSNAYPLLDRFFYLVGLNATYYFDFFEKNPHRYFEGGKLDLGLSNYGMDAGYVIDRVYYGGLGTNQSAGFLPAIYADLGGPGVVAGAVIVGVALTRIRSLDALSPSLAYLVTVSLAFALMNHPLNMLFLSNGLAIVLILAIAVNRRDKQSRPARPSSVVPTW